MPFIFAFHANIIMTSPVALYFILLMVSQFYQELVICASPVDTDPTNPTHVVINSPPQYMSLLQLNN